MKWLAAAILLFVPSMLIAADASVALATPAAPAVVKTCSIEASGKPVGDVLKEVASGTGETILIEKLVSGNVTASVKDVGIEKALNIVTKSLGIEWRKISVPQGSILAKDADALASQMRTVLALRFPDIVISPEGTGGSFVHVQREAAANELAKSLTPASGFTTVYLVTDDENAYKKEIKDESKKKVAKYVETSKQLMDDFLSMSPEERKAVLKESLNIQNQLGPEAMQEMMASVLEMDPGYVAQMNQMGMKALLSLNPEARQNMLRMSMRQQMEMMKTLTPEEIQMLQQEAAAIAAEMQGEQ